MSELIEFKTLISSSEILSLLSVNELFIISLKPSGISRLEIVFSTL